MLILMLCRVRTSVRVQGGAHPIGDWQRFILLTDFSEYPAECDKRRAFISGFNGSAGTIVPVVMFPPNPGSLQELQL